MSIMIVLYQLVIFGMVVAGWQKRECSCDYDSDFMDVHARFLVAFDVDSIWDNYCCFVIGFPLACLRDWYGYRTLTSQPNISQNETCVMQSKRIIADVQSFRRQNTPY